MTDFPRYSPLFSRIYSSLFSCLHDQGGPIGSFGRGAHYSVCRALSKWFARERGDQSLQVQDFAIVWDEDHDERVLVFVEALLLRGLLGPVLFIGERQGTLYVLADAAALSDSVHALAMYTHDLGRLCERTSVEGDSWTVEITVLRRTPAGFEPQDSAIISAPAERVTGYLASIDSLWQLGHKSLAPEICSHSREGLARQLEPVSISAPR